MQEVMIGTDRLPARRLTALGGCVIGMVVGAIVACAAGWFLIGLERSEARKQTANLRSEFAKDIAAVKEDALAQQKRHSLAPIAYVAGISARNSEDLIAMMNKFPAFKTDPYKQLFAELGGAVQKQLEQSQSLVTALGDPVIGATNGCSIAGGVAATPLIWTSRSVSLAKDGWRGIAP